MFNKNKYRTLTVLTIPFITTIILTIIVGIMLNIFASKTYKKMFIQNNLKISEHQVHEINHNKVDEKILIDNLESLMISTAKTVIENKDHFTNDQLRNLAVNFNLNTIVLFNSETQMILSTKEDFDSGELDTNAYNFNKSNQLFYNEGIRKSNTDGNYYMYVYYKDEVSGFFVKVSKSADDVYELVSRNNPSNIINNIFKENHDEIIGIALIDRDLNIFASTQFTEMPALTTYKQSYEEAFNGKIITRIRKSVNYNKEVLEVIVPVYYEEDNVQFIISTYYNLNTYLMMKKAINLIIVILAFTIISVSFSLIFFQIIKPLDMLEKSILSFNPKTAYYIKPLRKSYLFANAQDAFKKLSIHIDEINKESQHLNNQIYKSSITDFLTQIPNRRGVIKYIDDNISKNIVFLILFIDLDGFKKINDTQGHKVGDEVLIKTAKIFKELSDVNNALASRYGGDEFIIVINDINDDIINEFVNNAYAQYELEMTNNLKINNLSFSVGISKYPVNGDNTDDLIRKADLATYKAKQKNGYFHFHYDENIENNHK